MSEWIELEEDVWINLDQVSSIQPEVEDSSCLVLWVIGDEFLHHLDGRQSERLREYLRAHGHRGATVCAGPGVMLGTAILSSKVTNKRNTINNQYCDTHGFQDHTEDGKCLVCERERELVEACVIAEQTLRSLALGDLVGDSREIALNAAIRLWQVVEGRK